MKKIILFLGLCLFSCGEFLSQTLIMNEVSNGISGSGLGTQEYVEFVVVSSAVVYNCSSPTPPCIDIRGWIFDDNSGYHGASGIASGAIRFSQDPLWSCVPVGTIILIYNDADPNPAIPANDLSLSDGNCSIIVPISNTSLFEKNSTTPGAAACSYPATGWSAGGNWAFTALANSSDCARIVNLAGCEVFSVCYGAADNLNNLIYFSPTGTGTVYFFNGTDPQIQANWSSGSATTMQTPGAPNNAANAAYIAQFNNGCLPITPIVVTASSVNSGCGCTGSATASASGSIAGYTFAWFNSGYTSIGQNTATATGLCAGVYHVIGTSSIGCSDTATVTISSAGSISATATQTNVSCKNGTNGTATVIPSGGTTPYTYSWAPSGGTAATASGLAAGSYTCTITDAASCTTTKTFTITQPVILSATSAQSNVSCFGGANGTATVTASGGTTAYTYAWAPSGGTAATASGLAAGSYTCTITDANSCSITKTFSISAPNALTATTTQTNVTCNAGTNGTATVTASNGTPSYTYAWIPSGGNAATASGLAAGNYTCTITDIKSCSLTKTFTITQPTVLSVSATTISATCGNANGQATATATGGTTAYTYSWTPSGGTAATASGLAAGNFTITVTDANACVVTSPVTITNTGAVSATTTQINVNCFGGSSGSATVSSSGGTPAYTYAWAPSGGIASTANGLAAGNYTCTITDANSCSITKTFTITQPTALTATTSQTNVSCNAGTNGTATVTAGGGTTAYTYSWTPSGGMAASASGLIAGNYTCTITDANSCSITKTFIITEPAILTATTAQTSVSCNAGTNGTATVTASGGTAVYTYIWTPSGGTAATASGLAAGNYTCTITDANSCPIIKPFLITQPTILSATTTQANVSCNAGTNGTATVTANGGTGAYAYSWIPSGGTTAIASGLAAGNYICTIADANSCSITKTFTITQPTALTATSSQTNVSCNAGTNGTATVTASGGTGAYSYAWAPSGGTAATASGLITGNYTCTITDINSCSITRSFIITEPIILTATSSQTNVSCNAGTNGTATVTANGGTGAYTYAWVPTGGTATTASGLAAGNYTCTITDINLCSITESFVITEPGALSTTITSSPANCGNSDGSATITASGGTGSYTYAWTPSGGTAATASGLAAGNYTCTITDINLCTITQSITVNNTGGPGATFSQTNVSCNGVSDGTATVTASGGTPGYTYLWNTLPVQTTVTATGLIAGNYICTITDANSCNTSVTITITEPSAVSANATTTNVSCNGGSNGSALAIPSGGTGAYTYSWTSSANTSPNETGLAAGNYTVTVKDANNCSVNKSIIITEPLPIIITITKNDASCFGSCDGQAISGIGGGVSPYNYLWSDGQTTSTAANLCMNTFTLTITDNNLCVASSTITIAQPTQISISLSPTDAHCNKPDGAASSVVTGGTGTYTYLWSGTPSQSSSSAINLLPGTYTLVVTDGNNCIQTTTVTIGNLPGVQASLNSSTNASCFGISDGAASITASAGTPAYSYSWLPAGGTTSSASGLIAGTYTCIVTDAISCTATQTVVISEPPAMNLNVSSATICIGQTASLTALANGGTPTYTYNWNGGAFTGATINSNPTSTSSYSVIATDANGCQSTQAISTVTVRPPLAISINPNDSICPGNSASLTATASGGNGNYQYTWLPGNQTTAGITVSPNSNTTYSVSVSDACTSPSVSITTSVIIKPLPLVSFSFNNQPSCSPVCINFTDASTVPSGTITNWNWVFGDGSASNMQNPVHCFNTPGTYTPALTVTASNGCSASSASSLQYTYYPKPIANFTASNFEESILNPEVTLTNTSSNATSWNWLLLNGNTSNQNTVNLSFTQEGAYPITLIAYNGFGCTDTITKTITIDPEFTFYAPNAFTPSGDGLNEKFLPLGTGWDESKYNLWIFDRWGNKVFSSTNPSEGWNGKANGGSETAQIDTYVWKVELYDIFYRKHNYYGQVNIIR